MPVRFNGKNDFIGMLILMALPAIIAMFVALFMSPDTKRIFLLIMLLAIVSLIVNKRRRKS